MRTCDGCRAPATLDASHCGFCSRALPLALPTVFEVAAEPHGYSFRRDGVAFAVATRFGGRWRVSDDSGEPRLWLAPVGVAGSNDFQVVSAGSQPVGTIVRDRREPGRWHILDTADTEIGVGLSESPDELRVQSDGVLALLGIDGGTVRVLFTGGAARLPSTLLLALPLVFCENGALVPETVPEVTL